MSHNLRFTRLFSGFALGVFALASLFLAPSVGQTQGNQAVCVTVEKANLRSQPNPSAPITWTVGKYMPLRKLRAQGKWLQVEDMDGEKHWVLASMVDSRISCVAVKAKYVNLRKGPGAGFGQTEIAYADKYTPFKRIDRDEAWLKLEDEQSSKFWVYETNLWWPVRRSTVAF